MKYSEALQYMYDALPMYHRLGKSAFKKDLTNIKSLCDAMGNPEQSIPCFHIAGTNGKGSVSHLLAAVLQAHGFKTGLYVSPHYKDYRERIKIDGVYISKLFIRNFIDRYKNLFEEIKPSFFEMTVAMAFSWFKDQKVDYAVIETGLGGRLDSTNIIKPLLSIITNISWDHSDMLGDTLEAIAAEKAGIIKDGVPVLIGRRQDETKEVFSNYSKSKNATLYYADELILKFNWQKNLYGIEKIQTEIFDEQIQINPSLKGNYQSENIRTVLAACQILHNTLGIRLHKDKIIYAMEQVVELTRMIGRWQIQSVEPMIVLESAHNEDGIKFLVEQLKDMNYKQLHLICGFVKDKPLGPVLSLLPKDANYYFVKANLPRALEAVQLQEQALHFGLKGKVYKSVRGAFTQSKRNAQKEDLILVTGSIFVVGEVL
ncbi:MAG: bifunctional folylpolyglutamate synthase/dihydrofolate synthase [Saprospiraceae bacterium]|nr:bifunctional folylpolyglutamate synthase/dihydrofolate synthase [Saprospiraceae bacterium]MBK9220743.1 bifunctional folylpolyglutamate synthase/dihydrofolate synthase [Saprospiraceae bacterium]